eukprot:TRINITY_DN65261_c0_g1_i1.p1 TRINITY_DN65261_c0_g1~~TRINITY_DN65261_c0_g1_i1.p1  ORF type:complete len:175 (-),score=44.72 TRINITY_DN65261_c0_g1_i1:43-567(-)
MVAFDSDGTQFDGTDSMQLEWSAHLKEDGSTAKLAEGSQLLDGCRSLNRVARVHEESKVLLTHVSTNSVRKVDGTIVGLDGAATLRASLELIPTAHPSIQPSSLLAVCDRESTVVLKVLGGSGAMVLGLLPEGVAAHHTDYSTWTCLLYTSDAADEEDSVDLGGRRIIKKKKTI